MHGSAAGTGTGRDANINQFVLRGRGVRGRGSGHRGRTEEEEESSRDGCIISVVFRRQACCVVPRTRWMPRVGREPGRRAFVIAAREGVTFTLEL